MAEFFHGIHHGQDILRRNVVHHGVHGADHATATGPEYLHDPPHLVANFADAAERQNTVCVDTTAKDDVFAVSFLQRGQVGNRSGGRLDRVQDINGD